MSRRTSRHWRSALPSRAPIPWTPSDRFERSGARASTTRRRLTTGVWLLLTVLVLSSVGAGRASAAGPELVEAEPTTATFTGSATSANARFVVAGYQELLGRSADTAGLDFYVSRLTAGGDRTRQAFTYSMLFSVEGSRQEVTRAYLGLLGRSADAAGETYWTDHLQGHGVLDLRVLLLSSDEYYNNAGNTDEAWVEALYIDVLGRPSDAVGLAYWVNLVQSGTPRPLVVAGLYLSDEALGNRVAAYYQEALGREPSTPERTNAIDTIRSVGERGLRAEIWASDDVFEQYLQAALA